MHSPPRAKTLSDLFHRCPFKLSGLALSVCLICTGIVARAQTYTFTTIAGMRGVAGHQDGPGAEALLSGPAGLALDTDGRLYVAEDGNHTLRRLSFEGGQWVVSTVAGAPGESGSADGGYGENRFYRPRGLTVDGAGTLFVVDSYNSTVRQLTPGPEGFTVRTIAGVPGVLGHADGVAAEALFGRPTGIAVDPMGRLFVADMINDVIRLLELSGAEWYSTTIAGFPTEGGWEDGVGEDAEFLNPYSVVVESEVSVFVADTGNNLIRHLVFDGSGWSVTRIAGMTNAPADNVDGVGETARFNFPIGIAREVSGALFVTDRLNHTIRKLSWNGAAWSVTTVAGKAGESGTADGLGSEARFSQPWGVAVASNGTLFVADLRNHTIRMGVPEGTVTPPALETQFMDGRWTIRWLVAAGDYALESTESLGAAGWAEVTEGIVSSGGFYQFQPELSGAGAFFRLRGR